MRWWCGGGGFSFTDMITGFIRRVKFSLLKDAALDLLTYYVAGVNYGRLKPKIN